PGHVRRPRRVDGSGADQQVCERSAGAAEKVILDFRSFGLAQDRFWILDWGAECRDNGSLGGLGFFSHNPKSKNQKLKSAVAALTLFASVSILPVADQPKWREDWSRVVEAAKKEGQLALYGGQEITHPDIIAAFHKEFPFVKIISASGRGADMMTRIVAERRADK